jgi:hypothetical protein
MKRGLDSFNQQFQGWIMALNWQNKESSKSKTKKDVYRD